MDVFLCVFSKIEKRVKMCWLWQRIYYKRVKSNTTHTKTTISSKSPRPILHLDYLLSKQSISGTKLVIVLL